MISTIYTILFIQESMISILDFGMIIIVEEFELRWPKSSGIFSVELTLL